MLIMTDEKEEEEEDKEERRIRRLKRTRRERREDGIRRRTKEEVRKRKD